MSVFHDEVEIEDFEYDEESETYFFPCPCGDQFQITKVRSSKSELFRGLSQGTADFGSFPDVLIWKLQ